MEIEVVSENENKLLDRKEITVRISFSGATPSRSEIEGELAGKIGANPDLMVIRDTREKYGQKEVEADVHIYKNAEKLKEIEPEYMQKREGIGVEKKEEKPAEAAPEAPKTEEKPAEAPKEEKAEKPKEEKPPEEKKEEPKKEEKTPEKPKEEKPPEKKEEPKKEEKAPEKKEEKKGE